MFPTNISTLLQPRTFIIGTWKLKHNTNFESLNFSDLVFIYSVMNNKSLYYVLAFKYLLKAVTKHNHSCLLSLTHHVLNCHSTLLTNLGLHWLVSFCSKDLHFCFIPSMPTNSLMSSNQSGTWLYSKLLAVWSDSTLVDKCLQYPWHNGLKIFTEYTLL